MIEGRHVVSDFDDSRFKSRLGKKWGNCLNKKCSIAALLGQIRSEQHFCQNYPRACCCVDPSSAERCQATSCAQSKQPARVPTRMLLRGPVISWALSSHSLRPVQAASESAHAHASAWTRHLLSVATAQLAHSPNNEITATYIRHFIQESYLCVTPKQESYLLCFVQQLQYVYR